MRRRFDLTPLGHPVWWGALALLLVNDDLLKGRGVVPGWLTGKLSDFAFLIVAPVLFAALIPRRVPGRRTFAVAAVAGLFVAADLSRAVSDAVVALAARIGLPWRLWPDPTDLVALTVLPIAIWLLRRPPRRADDDPALRRACVRRERAGVVVGALACLATSAPPGYRQAPFLHNRTAGGVTVTMTWVLSKVDCATTPEALGMTLAPSDLDDPRAMLLQSGDVAALDGPPPPGTSAVGVCTTRSIVISHDCVAAILEADGATPVLMVTPKEWVLSGDGSFICAGEPPLSQCAPHLDPGKHPGRDTVSLEHDAGTLQFVVSRAGRTEQGPVDSSIQIAPIDPDAIAARAPAPDGCRAKRDAYRALLQSTACASNADCRMLTALPIPGETSGCAVYVNTSVTPEALSALGTQWEAMCSSEAQWCPPALAASCKAGVCVDQCAGVALPPCPLPCRDYFITVGSACDTSSPFTCLSDQGAGCSCMNGKVTCVPLPFVDPTCPLGCRQP